MCPARKPVRVEKTLPPCRMPESAVRSRQSMLFSRSGFQDQTLVGDFANDPVLVHFVRIHLTVRGWADVFGSRSRRKAVLFSCANNPVVDFKSKIHGRTPDGPKDLRDGNCEIQRHFLGSPRRFFVNFEGNLAYMRAFARKICELYLTFFFGLPRRLTHAIRMYQETGVGCTRKQASGKHGFVVLNRFSDRELKCWRA